MSPGLHGWLDDELEDLFRSEPELADTARALRNARPDAEADPHFRTRLRRQLMVEAQTALRPRPWWRFGAAHAAWGGAGVGAVLIGATALLVTLVHPQDHQTVMASSNVAAQHAVSPGNVITVAFNQPMDHAAVEAGVRIQPATKVSYSWQNNKLVITPVHHLAGNTPYTVTIAKPSLRASSGATSSAPIQISFGTAPTPPPGPSAPAPPALVPTALGPVAADATVVIGPDGSIAVSAGFPPSPTATSPSASSSPTPAASETPSLEGTPSPGPSALEYPAHGGAPRVLGPAATAIAFSPGGNLLALALPDPAGGSQITVVQSTGTTSSQIASTSSPVSVLSWASGDRVLYSDGLTIQSAQLSGHERPVATLPAGSGQVTAISNGGAYAYVAPASGTGGQLLNLAAGTTRLLEGAGASGVAFSADGKTIAWIDSSGAQPRLMTAPTDRDTPVSVTTLNPTAHINEVSLSSDGGAIAYTVSGASGPAQLVVAQLPSGAPLAVAPDAHAAVFGAGAASISFIADVDGTATLESATLPGASSGATPIQVPAAASATLDAFVDAQVQGDHKTLTTLSRPGVDAFKQAPHGVSRAYIISAATQPDGTVSASVELIVDPAGHHPTAVADETVRLSPSTDGSSFLVSAIDATPLHEQSSGPHVVHVSTTRIDGALVLQLTFDSDLDQSTLSGAISVTSAGGAALTATTHYDAATRTAVVTLAAPVAGALHIDVSTSLRDIDEQPSAKAFDTTISL